MSASCIGCRCAFLKFKRDRVAPLWKSTYRSVLFLFSQLTKYTYYVKAKKILKHMQRKLIIEAFGQPELADDSSIIADVYYVCPTCTKPIVGWPFVVFKTCEEFQTLLFQLLHEKDYSFPQ